MKKYIVLKEKELKEDVFDQEAIYFFASEDEANGKAVEVSTGISEAERDKYTVSIGIVDEADLEDPGNWATFTQVEIISIFD